MMLCACPIRMLLALTLTTATAMAGVADDTVVRPVSPTPLPDSSGSEVDVRPGARHGLLREGSYLLQAQGSFAVDEETSIWQFTVNPAGERSPVYVLSALANSYLAEVQQIVDTSPEQGLVFEVTGEVLVYHGRNYLLLTHPPRVVGHSADDETQDADDVASDEPTSDQSSPPRRDAESIMRDLEREVGPVQRRPASRADNAESDDARTAGERRLLREGSNVIMRRGRLLRDAGGFWQFVFDADANGLADPPMTLMPCLLLERLERHFHLRGNAPVLLSGRVFVYEERNHLLPTAMQLPREREMVMP